MGDFLGHAIPGSFFLLFAAILFWRQLHNLRRGAVGFNAANANANANGGGTAVDLGDDDEENDTGNSSSNGKKVGDCADCDDDSCYDHDDVDVQIDDAVERSTTFLKKIGTLLVSATIAGILVEGTNGITFFRFLMHEVLYLIHGLVGVGLVLEGYSLIPYDTSYYFLSVAKFQETLLWIHHGNSQNETEGLLHYYFALITFCTSVGALIVPYYPLSHRLRVYCISGGLFIEGVWMYCIGCVLYIPIFGGHPRVQHQQPAITAMQVPAFAATVTVTICLFVVIPIEIYMHRLEKKYLLVNNNNNHHRGLHKSGSHHPDCEYEQVQLMT